MVNIKELIKFKKLPKAKTFYYYIYKFYIKVNLLSYES